MTASSSQQNSPRLNRILECKNLATHIDILIILILGLSALFVLHPLRNTPFVDDWTYAWSVKHLIESGKLMVDRWTGNLPLLQIAWGYLFSLLFGFSFIALRLSTWVLWLAYLFGLYFCIKELGGGRKMGLFGAISMAVWPTSFWQVFTFMTDIPFLAFYTWSIFFMLKFANRNKFTYFLLSCLFSWLTIAIRFNGLVLPASHMLVAWLKWRGKDRWIGLLLPSLSAPILFGMLLYAKANTYFSGDTSGIATTGKSIISSKLSAIGSTLGRLPGVSFETAWFTIVAIGICLLPLTLSSKNITSRRHEAGMVIALCLIFIFTKDHPFQWGVWRPLDHDQFWSISGHIFPSTLIAGDPPTFKYNNYWFYGLTFVGIVSFSKAYSSWPRTKGFTTAEIFILALVLFNFIFNSFFSLYYLDRYLMPVSTLFVLLYLGRSPSLRLPILSAGLATYTTIAFMGTLDHLSYDDAVWRAINYADSINIKRAELDAGYAGNGWRQHFDSRYAPKDKDGRIEIPWIDTWYKLKPLNYSISNSNPNLKQHFIKKFSYSRHLAPSGSIYLLKNNSAQD